LKSRRAEPARSRDEEICTVDIFEIEDKQRLRREAAAAQLRAIADSLERHNGLRIQRQGKTLDLRVADEVELELEVEVEADGSSIEIEISW
jgi:amphi-Trp domain-containing protein